jgi:adenine-specific DNA-methyltransferase
MLKKLELTWIGKENVPRLEPRILLDESLESYAADARFSESDLFDNRLIFGDNLLALKALEQDYTGEIKCIFIDPPYNTGSAFAHYDDGLEHSLWLSMMRSRIELLHRLLSSEGSLWVTIDDNESPYLRVLLDEQFGRQNFVATICWQKVYSPDNRATISASQDYIHVYAKDASAWKSIRNLIPRDERQLSAYKNPDNDPRGPWKPADATAQAGHATQSQFYDITLPSGSIVGPPTGRCWLYSESRYNELLQDNRIWFGSNGQGRPAIKRFLSEIQSGVVPTSWWTYEEVGHNQEAKKEILDLFPGVEPFATPKPERLLKRIIQISTSPGDIVLDSFAGSGTTGAVAHKMGRRWIMVELGEHCNTHIVPRLKKVIDGTDQGGISKGVDWKGGGGFRYYRLAPSLMKQDKWARWVINDAYNPEMLAEAICKLEGYRYAPSDTLYWQHGQSTEQSFIYVTTQALNHEQLLDLSEEVGPDRTLLVSAMAFRSTREQDYPNLTLRKIPNQVLSRCEWGKDDYSLKVESLPVAEKPLPTSLFEDDEVTS